MKGRGKGKKNQLVKHTVPFYNKETGEVEGYDMYIDGEWVGSRNTIRQAEEYLARFK